MIQLHTKGDFLISFICLAFLKQLSSISLGIIPTLKCKGFTWVIPVNGNGRNTFKSLEYQQMTGHVWTWGAGQIHL